MENVVAITTAQEGISLFRLLADASLAVQLVMVLLLVASLVSWYMIFHKWFTIKAAHWAAGEFEDSFWAGGDMDSLYAQWAGKRKQPSGMASIFVGGFREYTRLAQKPGVDRADLLDGVQRAMRVALSREIESLETHLSFLATVGSTSPYVGLFGTVWGIMNSFRALGSVQHATIAAVAPGIAEALIATAMGLFAAIPAVIAYNRYASEVERLVNRYDTFLEEFSTLLAREAHGVLGARGVQVAPAGEEA